VPPRCPRGWCRSAGLCNKIFIKLMTMPLYNYPVFVNLISSFVYIPTSFSYIVPMVYYGRISKVERQIPQSVFITMGALDSLAGIMQLFATNFIASGSLLILLQQASIPLSMLISWLTLDTRYSRCQYAGAATVVIGIVVILLPSFATGSGGTCAALQCNAILWSGVLVLSCVPMCLSTVYKERALAKVDIDPIYLNGFVSLYQFLISIPLSIPAAPFTGIAISDVPRNAVDGWRCYIGQDSVTALTASATRPADECWPYALIFASAYLVVNQLYNILIILMLKFGSANLLYLAMTMLVPLGNIAFALPFMPNATPLTLLNFGGLVIILLGLFSYRFADRLLKRRKGRLVEKDLTVQEHMQQARRAAVIVGSASGAFALEGIQYLIDDMVLASPNFEKLERSPAQIRAGYLFKLGVPAKGGCASPSASMASPLLEGDDEPLFGVHPAHAPFRLPAATVLSVDGSGHGAPPPLSDTWTARTAERGRAARSHGGGTQARRGLAAHAEGKDDSA
jgi:uncharacterized membrane protein